MTMLCSLFFLALIQFCVAKPVKYNGYPEENRNVNNPLLFEGDMLISKYQKQIALSGGNVAAVSGRKRGATGWFIWPNAKIPFVIDSQLSANAAVIQNIQSAMLDWESGTCIQFVPRTNENIFLKIVDGIGCSSSVGFVLSPIITLGTDCYNKAIILHELGHAIGFWHEQSRPDRDNYVTIQTQNIEQNELDNFKKYDNSMIDSLGEPYDYDSIMHYGPKAFAKAPNLFTIVPSSTNSVVTLKKNYQLSAGDTMQANKLYGCQGTNGK